MIVVFARVPEPGRTKTRLVPALGEHGAAALSEAMSADVFATVRATGIPFRVCIAGPLDHPWVRSLNAPVEPQADGDLGARLTHALRDGGVAIGTDAPTLPASLLRDAHDRLGPSDVVLAPAEDGGYVLVGCRSPNGLFTDVPWSTDRTFAAQLARAEALHRSVALLPGGFDVDTPSDLARLRAALADLPLSTAPRTRAFLESLDAAPHR